MPSLIKDNPLRAVKALAAAYCLAVGGLSVYTLAAVRVGVPDVDAYMRCCHGLWEMILVNLIIPPIASAFAAFLVHKDAIRPANLGDLEHLRASTVYAIMALLGTFIPILAVTGMRALDGGRTAECAALVVQATAGGPPLLISVNLFYLGSNGLFCLGGILWLVARFSHRRREYAKHNTLRGQA